MLSHVIGPLLKRLDEQRGVHLEGLLGQLARKLGHCLAATRKQRGLPVPLPPVTVVGSTVQPVEGVGALPKKVP